MKNTHKRYIGILPCGGNQTRMSELVFSKELLPLLDGRPVIQHSIDAFRKVTDDIVAFVHPKKQDLVSYLERQKITVIQGISNGLPESIYRAADTIDYADGFLFALPDTFYAPDDVFIQLTQHPQASVIGLYETTTPERFDSVRMYRDRVTHYAIKQDPALSLWTMGCGKIGARDIDWFDPTHKINSRECLIGDVFHDLIKRRLLYGIKLEASGYYDLGTPNSYIEYVTRRFGQLKHMIQQ